MKILYLAHRIPYPPTKGDKIRSFHQIRYLSMKHTVHLGCLVDEPGDLQYVKALERYCASVDIVYRAKTVATSLAALALFTKKPLSIVAFYSSELAKKIRQRLNSEAFDRILVFSSAMAEYVREVSDLPKVMDFVDVDSEKWRLYADYHPFPLSWLYRLEAERLARYEEEVARAFDCAVFVSEKEACLLKRRVSDRPISIIPNGVDLDYFAATADDQPGFDEPALVFLGAMDYFPNVDAVRYFCGEVFPLIRRASPETRFYIVGRNPTRQVRALGHQPNVIVTGSVPDVRPYLAKARVAVAPLRIARGIQNKILEAMAMGLPVIGTSMAFQGLQATAADGIRMADDPRDFAEAVLLLLEDHGLRRRCALQARCYVERRHRWQDHGVQLESLLQGTSTSTGLTVRCTEKAW
jgi:sugar transferase (PEP-CTERM/EpsH1 system associated)